MTTSETNNNVALKDNDKNVYIESESGSYDKEAATGKFIGIILLLWAIFQLWLASPLPYILNIFVLNEDQAKYIHLMFSLFLAFNIFYDVSVKNLPKDQWRRICFATIAIIPVIYTLICRNEISSRAGDPTDVDVVLSIFGIIFLLLATKKVLGFPLLIVAVVFLIFSLAGPYMPEVISHKGASINGLTSHQWLTSEGIFGVALGVSTTFVFLFVLFGSLLDIAGAGNFFIKLSFSMLGHFRGGPAKAAVVASGLSGVVSGSSIANVVTTGTFTIPLMKRVGFSGEQAGAIEVAASTNGQLTPPIMGAAAFLMVEYIGIPYIDVIRHAILPALISYIALFFIVHLEASKLNIEGIARSYNPTLAERLLSYVSGCLVVIVIGAVVYFLSQWLEKYLGIWSYPVMTGLLVMLYIYLVRLSSQYPDLTLDDPNEPILALPDMKKTLYSGLYFLIPIIVLLWALAVKRFSPPQSAFFSLLFLMAIVLTHKPLKDFFRGEALWFMQFAHSWNDLLLGLKNGSRNMVGIGIATATAGIIVGTVTLTGLGQMMTDFVEFISAGHLLLILLFTAVICIILGMGLPTTANYIVVSTLMAPVIVTLAAENQLVIPLIAAHLFVFYFGILADDTPPVGLAAFAAAAISGADAVRTGIQGFIYDIRTAILPFMFIFNTKLLLIGIESWFDLLLTVSSSVIAMLCFASATQGFWLIKNKWWETVSLLLITFTLFTPGFWADQIKKPYELLPAAENLGQTVSQSTANDYLRLVVTGQNIEGEDINKTVALIVPDQSTIEERLKAMGLSLVYNNSEVTVDSVAFGSAAEKAGIEYGWKIHQVFQPVERFASEWMFIPVLLLLVFIYSRQKRRQRKILKD